MKPKKKRMFRLNAAGVSYYVALLWLCHFLYFTTSILHLRGSLSYRRRLPPPWDAWDSVFVRLLARSSRDRPSIYARALRLHPCLVVCESVGVTGCTHGAATQSPQLLLVLICGVAAQVVGVTGTPRASACIRPGNKLVQHLWLPQDWLSWSWT